ncbi:MAG: hypothetical protein ACTSW1_16430 [Candidatus Hodarchaeales archaeon]
MITDRTRLLIAFPYNDEGYSFEKMKELETRIKKVQDKKLKIEFIMHSNLDELLQVHLLEKVKTLLLEYQSSENLVYIGGNLRDSPPN